MSLHHVFSGHASLRPGLALIVAAGQSTPNGDTLVTLPCRGELLLLRSDAPRSTTKV